MWRRSTSAASVKEGTSALRSCEMPCLSAVRMSMWLEWDRPSCLSAFGITRNVSLPKSAQRDESQDWLSHEENASCLGELLLEALSFVMGNQGVDNGSYLSVHHLGQFMQREANAVIAHGVVRVFVWADFCVESTVVTMVVSVGCDGRC